MGNNQLWHIVSTFIYQIQFNHLLCLTHWGLIWLQYAHFIFLYPCSTKLKGVYWFHLVRPSVHMWTESCPLYIFYNTRRIHFLFAQFIKQLQKVCCVYRFFQNSKIWSFGKFFKFDFVLFWLGIQYELVNSMGNHGASGESSEQRHSSSSLTRCGLKMLYVYCIHDGLVVS